GAVNLPGWKYVELKKEMEKYFRIKTGVENDANCAIYGEKWIGAGKNVKNVVGFTLGTGVGGGIIIDGKLIRGANYNAAEIGHMSLNPDGRVCNCGAHGCLEQYASASAIANFAKERIREGERTIITEIVKGDINKITSKVVYEALISGDKLAKEVWNNFIKYLGAGIANVIHALNPELIIIAGGVINAGKYLFDPLKEAVKKQTFPLMYKIVKIVPAKLGELAGAIGAAGIVINEPHYYGL
ncbi:MAG: ROK family protein, partial [Candidatus Goldbacteria bacterium]|nr:ROK family protein [Candidatus Goldiibacteriota bacterium]